MRRTSYTSVDLAEQDGAAIASRALDSMLQAGNQDDSMMILTDALLSLNDVKYGKRAVGGFAVVMVPVLELGLANLPKVYNK